MKLSSNYDSVTHYSEALLMTVPPTVSNEEPKADRSGWKTLTEVIILLETGRLSLLQTLFEIVWEVVECGGKRGNVYPTPQTLQDHT